MSEILGLIPARGGSKGIQRKNISELAGRPLIDYSINASNKSDTVDRTIVSTDSEEIATVARECNAEVPFARPAELATDEAPTEPVVEHAINWLESDGIDIETIILLQPTSPLRTADHIDEAFEVYQTPDVDSVVSVYPDHSYRWIQDSNAAERINYDHNRTRRQEKNPEYVENGAIYIVSAEKFSQKEKILTGRTKLYIMNKLVSIDIDEPVDLDLAKSIINSGYQEKYEY
mgnify:FL=1